MKHNIGTIIKIARIEQGFSRQTMAKELGVNPVTISNWETGRRHPSAKLLIKVSLLLKLEKKIFNDKTDKAESDKIWEAIEELRQHVRNCPYSDKCIKNKRGREIK